MTWQAKMQCLLPANARGIFRQFRKNVNIEKHLSMPEGRGTQVSIVPI